MRRELLHVMALNTQNVSLDRIKCVLATIPKL